MRVVICSDALGPMSSARAGEAIAAGWSFAQVVVVSAGEAGAGFTAALADDLGAELATSVVDDRLLTVASGSGVTAVGLPGPGVLPGPIPYGSSSAALGEAVRRVVAEHAPRTLYVDLVCGDVHDGGAGFLAGLGARADGPLTEGVSALAGVGDIDLSEVRRLLAGVDLVGVVPARDRDSQLLGLRGITSLRGRAAGDDPERLLAVDAALTRWSTLVAADQLGVPGAGACGGVGLAVLALGGRLATGPELALSGLRSPVDLLVSGCTVFDFASRGGGVVAEAARTAARLLCPCLVIAGEVLIGAREMRTMGVEAAYPVQESTLDQARVGDIGPEELSRLAARVARSWRW